MVFVGMGVREGLIMKEGYIIIKLSFFFVVNLNVFFLVSVFVNVYYICKYIGVN